MRDCENCIHKTPRGCESWDCNFEPRMTKTKTIEIPNTDEQQKEIEEAIKMIIYALKGE